MDINGGQLSQTNYNPVWPGAVSTGPLIAGNVMHSDGSGSLAGYGEQNGLANAGYVAMCQCQAITQAGTPVTTNIVIPAQSFIVNMVMFITTAWSGGSTTYTVTDTASGSYASGQSGATLGRVVIGPGTSKSLTQQWQNVGNTDVQLVITSGNTGNGQGNFFVEYIQGVNSATSG